MSEDYEQLRPSSLEDKWIFVLLMAPAYIAMIIAVWRLSIPAPFDLGYMWSIDSEGLPQ